MTTIPRTEFMYRGRLFSDHGTDCGCTMCGYRVNKMGGSLGSVSLTLGQACWFQTFFANKYPRSREEAADMILDKHMPSHPHPVPDWATIPDNPKRRTVNAS